MKTVKPNKKTYVLIAIFALLLMAMAGDVAFAAAPVAVNDAAGVIVATTSTQTSVNIDLLANDSDPDAGDIVTLENIVSNPSHGNLTNNGDGTVTFSPTANYAGNDSFTYRIRDNSGNISNIATVSIIVGYRLTVNCQFGTVTQNPAPANAQNIYPTGTEVTLNAQSTTDYLFAYWSGNIWSRENPVVVTVNRTKTVNAKALNPAVIENLDEMAARKIRKRTAVWNAADLENSSTYKWQPETLMYKDVTTGHEVWLLSNTPYFSNTYHNDITLNPWSADGKYLSFYANKPTQAFNSYDSWATMYKVIWLITRTDGKELGTPVNTPCRAGGGYPLWWSPQRPGIYYQFGENHYMQATGTPGILYEVAVNEDGTVSRQELLNFQASMAYPTSGLSISIKSISSDGTRIMVGDGYGGVDRYSSVALFPTIVYPAAQTRIEIPRGYPYFRDARMAEYDNTPVFFDHAHADCYRLLGPRGDWFFSVPSGSHAHWNFKTIGSAPDGGPLYTGDKVAPVNDPPYDFGEIEPVYGTEPNPFNAPYMSHFAQDNWGHYALFSQCDTPPWGPGIWDLVNHEYIVHGFGGGAQHHDWHGFTDYVVSSMGPGRDANGEYTDYLQDRIYAAKFNDINSQTTVCYTHTRYDGGTDYGTLPRPGQSPDGTKAAYHGEYLNAQDALDIFWAVVYYPYPPTNLEATSSSGSGLKINFLPPKYTDRRWINPQTGQPDEVNGEELYAREIKQYHIWRSTSQIGPWQEIGIVPAEYANDPVTNTLKPKANGNLVSSSNKISFHDTPVNDTYYYALTSEEHSSLESDQLSEILKIVVSTSGQLTSQTIVAPKGQKDFWRTLPQRPSNFTYNPTVVPGHYRLNWTEPNDSKVRFYNIYYSTLNTPQPIQQNRIASLPKGTTTYLDWLADPSKPGYYAITSVDRYGNESTFTSILTAANLNLDQSDELVIDFGTNGIWVYSNTTNIWNMLHPIGSESIIRANLDSDPKEDLIIDFGQYGIWIYSNNSNWTTLHNINPDTITRANLDSNPIDDLVIDFGQYGIWIYYNNSNWSQLHTLNPDTITNVDLNSDNIDELVIDFGQEGVWVYYPNSRTWQKLHTLNPESITRANLDSDPKEDLIIDFGTNGIWIYLNNSTWVKLHTLNPDSITTANIDSDTKDDLIVDFGTNGIWVYLNNSTWLQIHTLNPESITKASLDSDTRDDLVIDFGTNGIWIYYNNNTWVKIHE